MSKKARDLAASGMHISSVSIIVSLVEEGYDEAGDLLGSPIIRDYLDKICMEHWPVLAPAVENFHAPAGHHTPAAVTDDPESEKPETDQRNLGIRPMGR